MNPHHLSHPRWAQLVRWAALGVVISLGLFGAFILVLGSDLLWPKGTKPNPYDITRSAMAAVGVITIGGGAAVALRRQKTIEDHNRRDEVRISLERDGQWTSRYSQAVEQLASQSISVRLGGVYALASRADGGKDNLVRVSQVLSAFVRESTKSAPDDDNSTAINKGLAVPPAADVAAAVGKLGSEQKLSQELARAVPCGANLRGANLEGADLTGADLRNATLAHAKLTGANFTDAKLAGTDLTGAELEGANVPAI